MKVLLLGCKDYPAFSIPWVHSGGMEVYVERMVRSLSERAEFTAYVAGGKSDEDARVVPLGAARGLRTQPLSLLLRSRRRLRRDGPRWDLLNPQTPLAALAALEAHRHWQTPYVVTVHIFGADPAHAGSRLAASAYGIVESLVFSRARAIIATGRRLGDALRERHPGAARKVHVVPAAGNGVSPAAPPERTRSRLGVPERSPVLLFLGRIVEENGLMELAEAFTRARREHPDLELWMAGTGDREGALRARLGSLGVADAVRWLGPLRGREKLDVLAAADLLVRFSRHEVFPEAYVEALSVGTPVVATPAGDTPHLAEDSGAVAVVPFDDPAAQAETLGSLLRDRLRLRQMKEAALAYAARVRWDDQRDRYWEILAEAAA